tara:strand:- start:10120 stop:12684 length:2565 start_codon:yes stop_codon:yes gene_type:complete
MTNQNKLNGKLIKTTVINQKRKDIDKLKNFYQEYPKLVDGYYYSNDRIDDINKNIKNYESYKETLLSINNILDNKNFGSDDSNYMTVANDNSNIIYDFLDTTSYRNIENKITNIEVIKDKNNISSIKYTNLDKTSYMFTNSNYTSNDSDVIIQSEELGENEIVKSIQTIEINNGTDGLAYIITTNYSELTFKPYNMSIDSSDYAKRREYAITSNKDTWKNHYKNNGNMSSEWKFASINSDNDMDNAIIAAQGLDKVFLGGKRIGQGNEVTNGYFEGVVLGDYAQFGENVSSLDDCKIAAVNFDPNIKIVGYRSKNHSTSNLRNTCYGYIDLPSEESQITSGDITYDYFNTNVKSDNIHTMQCTNDNTVETGCQEPPKGPRSGNNDPTEDTWIWVDGTPFTGQTNRWANGEPNNHDSKESYIELRIQDREYNDQESNKQYYAIFNKMVEQFDDNNIVAASSLDKQLIVSAEGEFNDINIYEPDESKIEIAKNLLLSLQNFDYDLDLNDEIINNIKAVIFDQIQHIELYISALNENITAIEDINSKTITSKTNTSDLQNIEPFVSKKNTHVIYKGNMKKPNNSINSFTNLITNLFTNISNFFNIKEGMDEYRHDIIPIMSERIQSGDDEQERLNEIINQESSISENDLDKYLSNQEYSFSGVLDSYLEKYQKGLNVNDYYSDIKQDNNNKKRNIELNQRNIKKYNIFLELLKILLIAIILIFIFLFLNKKELLNTNLTYALIITLIILVIIYSVYRYYNNNKHSIIDEDKLLNDEYVKQTRAMLNLDSSQEDASNNTVCSREECCGDNMVYDSVNWKCVESSQLEGFGNICSSDLVGYSLGASSLTKFFTQNNVTN